MYPEIKTIGRVYTMIEGEELFLVLAKWDLKEESTEIHVGINVDKPASRNKKDILYEKKSIFPKWLPLSSIRCAIVEYTVNIDSKVINDIKNPILRRQIPVKENFYFVEGNKPAILKFNNVKRA
ncbi:hypothetical protein [Metabacillus fastidiosus]|uniref:Uncharacterized protein n=1 Tax=Metabacillus fastidiosus TaxID=1458 RepID=A0ABU6NY69_9BACI|nr:hypothetical protein [Metabacillus fastidiosus]